MPCCRARARVRARAEERLRDGHLTRLARVARRGGVQGTNPSRAQARFGSTPARRSARATSARPAAHAWTSAASSRRKGAPTSDARRFVRFRFVPFAVRFGVVGGRRSFRARI